MSQPPDEPGSLAAEVASGDHRRALIALRDDLAVTIERCESLRDKAALVARLTDVLGRLASLPDDREVSPADEVTRRRTARRAGSHYPARSDRPL